MVSSGRMGGKGFFPSIQVDFTYLWIDSSIILRPSKMLLAPIFINTSCNAKLTVGYPFQNFVLLSRQKKSNVEDHCQRPCIYKCQLLKLMGTSHYNIKSMSYSDELIEQVIFFLFSFRLFCLILFLQSTFFLFVNLFIYFAQRQYYNVEKSCPGLERSSPAYTWATLGKPTFQTFPYKTRRAVYMRDKKLAWPEWWSALLCPQVAQARNMSIGEHRHCCVTFKI